ncbi:MAG: iron-sulfur cluster carrier protein ApbC [Betaproteobacteria bacterium]|jgi:ATP-binding protein involved in chromosome partitioning|nr:iron-sulfur cluster carrier protein ApbC [Rhodocyclaceae bacterium]MCA3135479.1 iron-sulfur cluster carrier protein ApbC [Rhodocyclaceae bacterium]MCA3142898.1 iron-sulfur cluster carrier protein ApbC [Rhodocyclaceae bacterium]MCA3144942.1 iron-sulfur cluster carrier protein ApbC [Rhodocyclaceae bacterium]
MAVLRAQVEDRLREIIDPWTGQDYLSGGGLRELRVDCEGVAVDVVLGYPAASILETVRRQIGEAVRAVAGGLAVSVNVSVNIAAPASAKGNRIPGVKNIVAVASGKGGVGKSTVAVNLALALAAEGARVGILDADIYGPSQPTMLGLQGSKPVSPDGKSIEPMEAHGVQAMSIGFLVDVEQPMVWRGPMATGALEQLLRDTRWRDLDYLVVDMPPGTGDIQLTLAQKVPVTGAVIVTTPQDIALIDARKGLRMFEKVSVPILGVVENMGLHVCSNCGHEEHIFGSGGGEAMAQDYGVPLLGTLPLDLKIRLQADSGKPTVAAEPDGSVAHIYRVIARRAAAGMARLAAAGTGAMPRIAIQNT